jgi:threonine dehydratase
MPTTDPARRPAIAHPALEPDAIRAALATIHPAFRGSPQFVHDGLSTIAGAPVVVKVESANPIGAFKGRGTWLAVHGMASRGEVGPGRPVVVASTGNFGQGVAFAARAAGVPAVVFCDEHANARKVAKIRSFGADVRQVGRDFDEARAASESFAVGEGLPLLVDGDDVLVAAGAATLALEVTDAVARGELPPIANAYVPLGNGALLVGVGAWLRAAAPDCRVVGIQAAGAPSMERSWREGRAIETPSADTYAEGIATRVPVPAALALMDGRVDEILLVGEDALHAAADTLTTELGITAEGSAAASWAGLLADGGKRPGASLVILTGANIARG